jgi:glycosyltransferase involved in cell wall biosynthesis
MKNLLHKSYRNKKPFFSIITVVKNDDRNITKTLKSIGKLSCKNFEYIVIDGASTDKTLKKLKKFKRINLLISQKDKGIYHAMNKGLKYSKGEVVVFVNSGDVITKNSLKIVNKKFIENKNVDFVFGTVLRNYKIGKILKYGYSFKKMLYNFDFATSHTTGFFLKNKVYKKLGFYDTQFQCSADYDMYFRLYKKNYIGDYTSKNQLIGIVASGGFSSQISFIDHIIEEARIRIKHKQNLLLIFLIFLNALIKGFFKIIIRKLWLKIKL